MNTSEKIFSILENYVDTIFFVPGGGCAFLANALGDSKLNHISAICESGAVSMATGYAMVRNKLGVCLVTSGPGLCNSITGIASAWTDSIPLLVIGGQAKSSTLIGNSGLRTRGIQEVDGVKITRPITKLSSQAVSSKDAIDSLNIMIKTCLEGRKGGCFLEIPLDIQGELYEK